MNGAKDQVMVSVEVPAIFLLLLSALLSKVKLSLETTIILISLVQVFYTGWKSFSLSVKGNTYIDQVNVEVTATFLLLLFALLSIVKLSLETTIIPFRIAQNFYPWEEKCSKIFAPCEGKH